MRYLDKVIKGEDEFRQFLAKFRPNCTIEMCENTGRCFDVQFERFYEMAPDAEYYQEYYWLTIPTESDKGFTDGQHSTRRKEIYEGIRNGSISGKV